MPDAPKDCDLLQYCLDRLRHPLADVRKAAEMALLGHAYERLRQLAHELMDPGDRLRRLIDSGDLLHETIERLLKALRDVQPRSVAGFLALAAEQIRRQLIDLARKHYGKQGYGANTVNMPKTPPRTRPNASWRTRWLEVFVNVDCLTPEERAVFDLHGIQRLTHAEVAAQLGIAVPTVKKRWRSALVRLRRAVLKAERVPESRG